MNYLAYHESKVRGTFDFPIEFYYVDAKNPCYNMALHWHMEYELILILQGEFAISLDSEAVVLHEGDIALVPDGVVHGGMPSNCIYECIVFDLMCFLQESRVCHAAFAEVLEHAQLQRYFAKGSAVCKIADAMFEAMEKEQRGYELITTGLLWQLMGTVLQQQMYTSDEEVNTKKRGRINRLKKVLQRIRNDYTATLTLNDLAAEAGMTSKYFCRVFYEITGRTPIDYLNYYRIECASERLLASDDSITEIALSCGFNDLGYFTRAFRKYKGTSAKKYRLNGAV